MSDYMYRKSLLIHIERRLQVFIVTVSSCKWLLIESQPAPITKAISKGEGDYKWGNIFIKEELLQRSPGYCNATPSNQKSS